jgi:hypothetical protein
MAEPRPHPDVESDVIDTPGATRPSGREAGRCDPTQRHIVVVAVDVRIGLPDISEWFGVSEMRC